jgi:hypothetical protein
VRSSSSLGASTEVIGLRFDSGALIELGFSAVPSYFSSAINFAFY